MNYKIVKSPTFKPKPLKRRDQWTAALRSGNYKQTQHWLKVTENDSAYYCCLGVLCEIEKVPNRPEGRETLDKHVWRFKTTDAYENAVLSEGLVVQFGVLNQSGKLFGAHVDVWDDPEEMETHTPDRSYDSLTELNDAGFSFEEIADVIDACFTHVD